MLIDKIKSYKIDLDAKSVEIENKHVENYIKLINFLETAMAKSLEDNKISYVSLHNSCLQMIRYLDQAVVDCKDNYKNINLLNETIDKMIEDDSQEKNLGNEISQQKPNY